MCKTEEMKKVEAIEIKIRNGEECTIDEYFEVLNYYWSRATYNKIALKYHVGPEEVRRELLNDNVKIFKEILNMVPPCLLNHLKRRLKDSEDEMWERYQGL